MNNRKVDVTVEERSGTPEIQESLHHLKKAGEVLKPFGFNYQGSATIHFYHTPQSALALRHQGVHIVQTAVGDTPETQADAGFKELKKQLMLRYNRKLPDERA